MIDKKELKLNHIVQIREKEKFPKICIITNIGDSSVDVQIVKDEVIEVLKDVPIESLSPIDILEPHVLAFGFVRTSSAVLPDLSELSVFSYERNGKKILIAKTDRFHMIRNNVVTGHYEIEKKLLTLHNLQNEMSTSTNMVDSVNKKTFLKLSKRYDLNLLDKDKYCEFQLIK
jgi:hypothetical protein